MTEQKIDRSGLKSALLRSGYLLESRLETILRNADYLTEANYAYPDPITGTSRELDLYAIKMLPLTKDKSVGVFLNLLIECVNNPQPIAFMTKERDGDESELGFHDEINLRGVPAKILVSDAPEKWETLPRFLQFYKNHHYYTQRYATQFCSFRKKKEHKINEWMAHHDDRHFDAFRKLSDVVEFMADRFYRLWLSAENRLICVELHYPILVLQGDLINVRTAKRSVRIASADHILFKRSSVTGMRQHNYFIDAIRESYFPKYLATVEKELQQIRDGLDLHYDLAMKSVNKIVDEVYPLEKEKKRFAAESVYYRGKTA